MNPIMFRQMLMQLMSNPAMFVRQSGYNIAGNMNNPNSIIQYLLNSGQVTQQQYDRAMQTAMMLRR